PKPATAYAQTLANMPRKSDPRELALELHCVCSPVSFPSHACRRSGRGLGRMEGGLCWRRIKDWGVGTRCVEPCSSPGGRAGIGAPQEGNLPARTALTNMDEPSARLLTTCMFNSLVRVG